MSKNNGGPAFPREDYQCNGADGSLGQEGMSLRDYFAAKAMSGLVGMVNLITDDTIELISKRAFQLADAMIKARGDE